MAKKKQPSKQRTVPQGKALLDDIFLNEGERALEEMSRRCESELGHKPSLEDFRQLLDALLCVDLEDYFADGATIEVTDVVFVTKPKSPPQQHRAGDIFAIPLGDDRYAFGRVLHVKPQFGVLIEVFRETSPDAVCRPSIEASGRLFEPIFASPECLASRRWAVIQSDPAYRISKADARIDFEQNFESEEVEERIRESLKPT
jgi:hypothetical protein